MTGRLTPCQLGYRSTCCLCELIRLGGSPLAGQDTGPLVAQPFVLTEHEANLAAAHSNVSSWHIGVLSDVAGQLRHEGLAESHHLQSAAS